MGYQHIVIAEGLDSVIPTKLLVVILMLLLMISTKNEEQILALERATGSPRRTENRPTENRFHFALSDHNLLPPTTIPEKTQILNRSASDDEISWF